MDAADLAEFKLEAAAALAAVWPGTITINGTDYAAAVVAGKGPRQDAEGNWVQVRTLSAQVLLTVMALSVVVDTAEDSQPVRENIIVIHGGIRYRLDEVKPDPHGGFMLLKCSTEHPAVED